MPRRLSPQDRALWASYATGIHPLPGRERPSEPAPSESAPSKPVLSTPVLSTPVPPAPDTTAPPPLPITIASTQATTTRPTALVIGQSPGGIDKASWQRFRAGKLPVERTLDLHGLTVQRAYERVEHTLLGAAAQGLRCVEIVTGRGSGAAGGVLRREFPLWLNLPHLRALVLAAAHPHAANDGAVRVLLRRTSNAAAPPAQASPRSRR